MSLEEKTNYLLTSLNTQIASFQNKRRHNRNLALGISLTTVSLGAMTTILLGVKDVGDEVILKNIALVLSACVTIVGAVDSLFHHRALWIRYTETVTSLYSIKSDLEYAIATRATTLTAEQVDRAYQRFQEVLRLTNQWWSAERKSNAKLDSAGTSRS